MQLRQFRSFYVRHYPESMEQLIEYFAVFGGLEWQIDINRPLEELIVEHILENYGHLYNEIARMTLGDPLYHRLLSAIAVGDRRMYSAFKRARISEAKGGQALSYLRDVGMLRIEHSREEPPLKTHPKQKLKREVSRHRISHKMRFNAPFLRFWFYFIAPLHKSIEAGDYEQFLTRFAQRRQSFTSLVYEELSDLLLQNLFLGDPIVDTGSYWDRQVEIDILARTAGGKLIIGECKWTNTKINKSELGKLREKCELIDLEPDIIALFSKRGFSKELEAMRDARLQLYRADDFRRLLEGVSQSDLIQGFPTP
jgi:AAA+ ATPase superfamily predicted ATPase